MLEDWQAPAGCRPTRRDTRGRSLWRADEVAALADRLATRGAAALAAVPLDRRLAAWSAAVEALLDPGDAARRRLFRPLVATSGLSPEGLTEALDVIVGGAGPAATAALAARLPPTAPRGLGLVVLAANVPGLAVQTILPALLVGRPLLVKSSSREPLFAPALVRELAAREPGLADAFAAVAWERSDAAVTRAALAACERVVAYGGAEAVAELGELAGARLVALGPRASVALVAGERDPLTVARAIARDVALLDQRGCLSVHAVYADGDARELAEALAFALAGEHLRLPPGPIAPRVAASIQQLRGVAALAAALVGRLELAQGTVLLAPDAAFRPSPGARLVRVHAVARLDEALAVLATERGRLQGAALAGAEASARVAEITERLGLARVAPAGRLQHAEAGWTSGGIDPLTALG